LTRNPLNKNGQQITKRLRVKPAMTEKMKKYWELFFVFFKLGAFTFGGGYAMVPLIRNEVVQNKRWIEDEEFMDMLSIALSAPGPIALNTALFVGNRRLGFKGSLVSAAGVILPSFLLILTIAIVLTQFRDNALVERLLKGIRPAVVALIAAPLLGLGKSAGVRLKNIWIPIAVAFAVWWLGVSPVYIVLAAISLGILHLFYLKKVMRK
jgi:chromate transporter